MRHARGREKRFTETGYVLDSGNRGGSGSVGRSPWTARDTLVPLPEAEAGAAARARAPAPRNAADCTRRSQAHTHLTEDF
jgi:hypothetical protein